MLATPAQKGGDKTATATALGISLKTLYNRFKSYTDHPGRGPAARTAACPAAAKKRRFFADQREKASSACGSHTGRYRGIEDIDGGEQVTLIRHIEIK
ncbi:MAG: hypothetical protein ACK2U9_06480 [Anaerolineae bacterium]